MHKPVFWHHIVFRTVKQKDEFDKKKAFWKACQIGLDQNDLVNYKLISYLPFLSKI